MGRVKSNLIMKRGGKKTGKDVVSAECGRFRLVVFVVLLGVFTMIFTPSVSAADKHIYIDSSKESSGNGSEESPYGSFSNICWADISNWVAAGDTVYLDLKRGSKWYERLNVQASGVNGRPITIQVYGTGKAPIINEMVGIVTEWTDNGNGTYKKEGIKQLADISENGVILPADSDPALNNGNYYYNSKEKVLYYRPASGVAADHTVRYVDNYNMGAICMRGVSYITIKDLELEQGQRGVYGAPMNKGSPVNCITVQNCKITSCKWGMLFLARNGEDQTGHVITGNTITKCGEGILVGAWASSKEKHFNVIITNNTIIDTGLHYGTRLYGGDKEGIGLQNVNDSDISGNTITGYAIDGGIAHWVGGNNKIGHSSGNNNTFLRNYIHDLDGCGIVHGTEGSNDATGNLVAYNVIVNVGNGPKPPYGGLRLNRVQQPPCKWVNNTLHGNDINIYLNTFVDYHIIKNNISSSPRNYHIYSRISKENNVIDNNLYYPDTGRLFEVGHNKKRYNFAEWETESSQDANSPAPADPKFVDPANNDFRLQAGSPCIDAGASVGLSEDYANNKVPKGSQPDIGAFEYDWVKFIIEQLLSFYLHLCRDWCGR